MANTKSDKLYALIASIRPAHRRLARAVSSKLEGTGISVGMRAVMEVLHDQPAKTVPEIARAQFLARQQVQLLVNELLLLDLARRKPNPAHKRSPLVELTENGTRAFRALRAVEDESLAEATKAFDLQQVEVALDVMRALTSYFEEFEDDPDKPGKLA